MDKDEYYALPDAFSNSFIPGSAYEAATPNMIRAIDHLAHLADKFNELDHNAEPLILIGRDSGYLMKNVCHGDVAPFACETPLGFALIGSPCLNYRKKFQHRSLKTKTRSHFHYDCKTLFSEPIKRQDQIFDEYENDEELVPSRDEIKFNSLVSQSIGVNGRGNITMSLPFKNTDIVMPNNQTAVFNRTNSSLIKLKSQPKKFKRVHRFDG